MSSNDIIYQSKGALIAFLEEAGFETGSSDVQASGTPLNNEVAVWVNSRTIGGSSNLTFDGTDFRVATADESHMFFIEGSSNRVSIGDSTNSPGATLEVTNHASAGATGVPLVQLNSNDTDQQCLDINAANVTANVVNITANDVTTARVLSIGADGLTTGNAFRVEDDSADTGTRNTALVVQNNAAAIAATALTVQSDGGVTGVKLDKNYSDTTAATITGLNIDFDKTAATTTNNTMYGLNIDMDNTTATNGNNYMYGLHVTPTLTHAADAGGAFLYGALINAQGGTNGSSLVQGARIEAGGGDINYGIQLDVEDGGVDLRIESSADSGDYFQIQTTTHGATTITTVDDNASAADLTFTVDGDITLTPVTNTVINGYLTLPSGLSSSMGTQISNNSNIVAANYWIKVAESRASAASYRASATIDVMLAGYETTAELYQARVYVSYYPDAIATCQVDIIQDAGSEAWDTSDFILTYDASSDKAQLWVRDPARYQRCYATITNGSSDGNMNYKADWYLKTGQSWASSYTSLGAVATTTNVKKRFDSLVIDGDLTVTGNDINGSGGTAITMDGSNNVTIAGDLTVGGLNIKAPADSNLFFNTDKSMYFDIDEDDDETSNIFRWRATSAVLMTLTEQADLRIAGDLQVTGSLKAGANADIGSQIGRAQVGYGGGYSDYAWFSHVDSADAGEYAIIQDSSGNTFLNCQTGAFITFRVNNSSKMTLASTGIFDASDAQEAWSTPSYAGNWGDYGSGWEGGGYVKDSMGFVHLRGLIKATGAGDTIFTLPTGYRPPDDLIFTVQYYDYGTSGYVHGRVDVKPNGIVDVDYPATVGANDWVSLSGITFSTQ